MRTSHTTSTTKGAVFVLAAIALSLTACKDKEPMKATDMYGEWHAARVIRDTKTEKVEYTLNLDAEQTYEMETVRSRKVDDEEYYVKIMGSERMYSGDWTLSEDGKMINCVAPEIFNADRLATYDGMELTISTDGKTMTRTDPVPVPTPLVFTQD